MENMTEVVSLEDMTLGELLVHRDFVLAQINSGVPVHELLEQVVSLIAQKTPTRSNTAPRTVSLDHIFDQNGVDEQC